LAPSARNRDTGGDRGEEDRAGHDASRPRPRARSTAMASDASTAADLEQSSARWRTWLARELARRTPARGSGPGLLALWDVLEEWLASDDFVRSPVAAAVAAPPHARGPAARAALAHHRRATRRLLEDLAEAAGVPDPPALAGQLLTLVEGAIVGALVDRHPAVVRHARELTRIALAEATASL
jgi:hypothetical protein